MNAKYINYEQLSPEYIPTMENRLSRMTAEEIKNEKNYGIFQNKLSNLQENLNNSNKLEINKKLKKHYSKYYENDLNKKSILEHAKKIKQKYESNKEVSHNLLINIAPRNVQQFEQDIYMRELQDAIQFLIANIDNSNSFPDFLSIVLFVAKKRKIIEYLKFKNDWELFGSLRNSNRVNGRKSEFISNIFSSSGAHLLNNKNNELVSNIIKYNNEKLTEIRIFNNGEFKNGYWIHPSAYSIPRLLYLMNKLYKKFNKSLSNKNNIEKSKDLLCELYWLFMQTCPFERGSAAIAEIIFSALLQKHFRCNFKLLTEPYNPRHIPDIHALTYPLEKFKVFFWEKLVSKNNNSRNQPNSKRRRTNPN